ncbi:DoxX family protein [Nonomuraea antri]|uniref:DoxX family protein n=1 Tax=Nonomuraea antri TaxID=2730852 RepID=UPI001C2CC542|nr:DoxX family protein [Nonomuraea antri]
MKRVLFDVAALIARVAIGVIFVAHGWQKWQNGLGATTQGFRQMGIPMPELAAGFASVVETVGGICLILGLGVRVVALLLLANMIGAIAFVHAGNGVFATDNGWELPGALAAISLLFLALGGGRIGLDGIIRAATRRRAERRAAEEDIAAHAPGTSVRRTEPTTVTTETTTVTTEPPGPAASATDEPARNATPTPEGPATPASGETPTEQPRGTDQSGGADQPRVPRQPAAPDRPAGHRAGNLSDEDMRDIDALVSDEPTPRKPPNRG